jgi:hypothetical protein
MPAKCNPCCKLCQSDNQSTFNSEMAIHFPGLKGLDKPIVWVFPKITVCLKCGFSELVVPDRELQILVRGVQDEVPLYITRKKEMNAAA